jgi:hypothetical protein
LKIEKPYLTDFTNYEAFCGGRRNQYEQISFLD